MCVQSLDMCADVVFIGPVGSGKSSLIGSIYRAVNEDPNFPARVHLTLNHPGEDSHGTMRWMETNMNAKGTIVYQDTRGDQVRGGGQGDQGRGRGEDSYGTMHWRGPGEGRGTRGREDRGEGAVMARGRSILVMGG